MNVYAVACTIASCDESRRTAFDSVSFFGFQPDNFSVGDSRNQKNISKGDIYCCQSGRNCDDGYNGCEPGCTACCDTDSCVRTIYSSCQELLVCTANECIEWEVCVPYLYNGGNSYSRVDWSAADWTQERTCNYFKNLRTLTTNISTPSCQSDGLPDADNPCTLKFVGRSSDSKCPTNCPSFWQNKK